MLMQTVLKGLLFFTLCSGSAIAGEAEMKKNLSARFPGAEIQGVVKTPYLGLYEVFIEGQLVYTDEKVNYIFVGSIVDAKTQRNMTEQRLKSVMRVKFGELPLEDALKVVKGDGKRKLVVFSDPDCPYCKRFEQELQGVSDVTIYTFLYPIESLHSSAVAKSKAIWCSPDKSKAWDDYMLRGTSPKNDGKCETPVDKNIALAKKLRIFGTPALIFEDGRMVPGMVPAAQLEKLFQQSDNVNKK